MTETDADQPPRNWADRLADAITVALNAVVTFLMFLMCAVTIWQVFTRYVLNDASGWSEEVTRYAMLWMVMIGSVVVIRTGGHVTVTVLIDRVSPKTLKWLLLLRDAAMLFVLVVITLYGVRFAAMNSVQISPAMDIPLNYIYAALWIGAGLMAVMLVLVRLSKTPHWTDKADGFD